MLCLVYWTDSDCEPEVHSVYGSDYVADSDRGSLPPGSDCDSATVLCMSSSQTNGWNDRFDSMDRTSSAVESIDCVGVGISDSNDSALIQWLSCLLALCCFVEETAIHWSYCSSVQVKSPRDYLQIAGNGGNDGNGESAPKWRWNGIQWIWLMTVLDLLYLQDSSDWA